MDILLTEPLIPEAMAWLGQRYPLVLRPELASDAAALRAAAYRPQAMVLSRKLRVTREFLDFAPRLRVLARLHADTDNTDLEACRERRVRVIQARSAHVRPEAEYLLSALLMLYRPGIGLPLAGQRHAQIGLGREVNGSTVGLLGLAPAAHTLALLLRGLGARLIGYDPAVHASSPTWRQLQVEPVTLPELVAQADAVSVQVIYASRYKGLVGEPLLSHCKPKQCWVGISRSDLFDADALARALADGRIEACVLDGAEAGFASRGTPLHEAANLYLTPRLGSHTREARARASWYVAARIHELLRTGMPERGGSAQREALPR
ncbi:NAD(P)-dependent oxidoreductase [Ramlibacter rhizophilus]|uniref:Hydroxyacid dehydrogenase n=1 Tax=Ramlibacter rhizophilus TaxID=1781167 RepID=A0A4Z0BT64_9BURK|nr:NAD(P)-dependent oxidoreductase [Ramlibacter rhizophilus]TFZ01438.1 hydroxyacid dehydrogenase [Ramlibacter rhizophilus]